MRLTALVTGPLLSLVICVSANATVATFEDQGLSPGQFVNNAGPGGQFVSGGDSCNNVYDSTDGSWYGWAISSTSDTTTPGDTNEYSAIAGSGAGGSATFAVAYTFGPAADPFKPASSIVNLPSGVNPTSVQVTNTTYAYLSMRNGDDFESAFAAGDYFLLGINGYTGANGTGTPLGSVDFYLANFLNGNSSIVDTWQTVDLTSLAGAQSLQFELSSSANDPSFGMNTPAYFALDNLVTTSIPEPGAASLLVVAALAMITADRRRR